MSPRGPRGLQAGLRAGRYGTFVLFFIGIAAVTPLAVVEGGIPLGYGQVHQLGVPAGYMTVAVLLAVFAVGLAAMARHVPNSGAFYSYVAAGLGKPPAVATAAVALVGYNAMQVGLVGLFGVAASIAFDAFGVPVNWGVCAAAGWAAIACLGQLKVKKNARILAVLVCAEILLVVVLDTVMIGHPAGGTVRYDTLNPGLLANAKGAASLVGAITGLVGFEIPLAFAPLARDPRRTTRRAIYLILFVVAVLYGGSGWAMSVIAGPEQIIAVAGRHPSDLFFFLAAPHVQPVVIHLGLVLFATSAFAAMLAFHSTVARYTLTLAREGVLPAWLGKTRADEVPVTASAVQSVIAILVLVLVVVLRLDPTVDLFFFGTVTGGLGVLILMCLTAVAVIRFFHHHRVGENVWRRRIAPIVSAVFLILVLAATLAFYGNLLGTTNPVKIWSGPGVYAVIALAGICWAYHLQKRRPDIYAVIGHGDRTTPASPAARQPGIPGPRTGTGRDALGATGRHASTDSR